MISNDSKNNLLKALINKPIINLLDQEDNYVFNEEKVETEYIPYESMSILCFIKSDNKNELYKKYIEFKKEVESNNLQSGINMTAYAEKLFQDFSSLNIPFDFLELNSEKYFWRNDLLIQHNAYSHEHYNIADTAFIPKSKLTEISDHCKYQRQIIEKSIQFIQQIRTEPLPRHYGTSYQYNYFKFTELSHLGSEREINDYKIEFFKELIRKALIRNNDLKAALSYFNDISYETKIHWLGTREELFYLMHKLVKIKLIVDPKRMLSKLIVKVFCDGQGNNYNAKMFYSLHKPSNTLKIDQILGILK